MDDIEADRARVIAAGLALTPIHDFETIRPPCRMFFLNDPDGIPVEMIQNL